MAKKIQFYRCPICRSVLELVYDGHHSLNCCSQTMELLKAQETGDAIEYHLPILKHRDGMLYVNVGAKPHPQSEDHHIQFIVLVTKQTVRRSDLRSTSAATAVFSDKDHGDVYAYCTIHGLYKTSF